MAHRQYRRAAVSIHHCPPGMPLGIMDGELWNWAEYCYSTHSTVDHKFSNIRKLNIPFDGGFFVKSVEPDSCAEKLGLEGKVIQLLVPREWTSVV